MNEQCKFCIHSAVCAYKEHYEDAVELYEKAKDECSKYPFFVCEIRCIKYCEAEKVRKVKGYNDRNISKGCERQTEA